MSTPTSKAAPVATLSIDLGALLGSGVVVQAPAPLLLTPANASTVGLEPGQLADIMRAMRRDPAWTSKVIAVGKVRAVEPHDLIAYMRAVTTPHATVASTPPAPAANDTAREARVDARLAAMGLRRT